MTDTVPKSKRSEIMATIRDRDSKIEVVFRKALWNIGYRYRKNHIGYYGKPDLLMKSLRTVVFIDSCFWHGCNKHCRMPNTRREYWMEKISRNKRRDKKVTEYYLDKGWTIHRYWEHDLKSNFDRIILEWEKRIRAHKDECKSA